MKRLLLLCLSLLTWGHATRAEPGYKIEIDFSKAPECEPFARQSQTIAAEWYPKIYALLFGAETTAPARTVHLIFEPMKGVAHAGGNDIHISAEWVTVKSPHDYGMVVHELTHVVQDYRGKGEFWLTEGIADYVRYEHYEPGKQNWKLDPAKSSYRQGYGIAGAFLAWLEKTKNPRLVPLLNAACHEGKYRPELFKELCGADADTLWREYLAAVAK